MWTSFDNGTKYNEISYAQELSEQIPVKNISHIITPEEFWGNFGKIQYHMDEPLADPAAVALYFVCNLASQHLKVVLSGEGADEIFGGYNIYKEPLEMQWYDIRKLIGKIAGALPAHRGLNFLVRRGKRLEERFIGNAYMFTEKERQALLKHPTGAPAPEALCKPYYDMVRDKDPVTKMQFVDLNMWMVGDILLKADKMSMANSLELRVPFLDKKIMALAGRIPLKYRVNEENTKYAMRADAGEVGWQKEAGLPGAHPCVAEGGQVLQHRQGRIFGGERPEVFPHGEACQAAGRPQKRQGGQQPPGVDGVYLLDLV